MLRYHRNLLTLALTLATGLAVLLLATQLTNTRQMAHMRELTYNNIPQLLTNAQSILQKMHQFVGAPSNANSANMNRRLHDMHETLHEILARIQQTLREKKYAASSTQNESRTQLINIIARLNRQVIHMSDGVEEAYRHPERLEILLNPTIMSMTEDLHTLLNATNEQNHALATKTMAEIDATAHLSLILLVCTFFAAAGLFFIIWKQSISAKTAALQTREAEQRNALLAAAVEAATIGIAISDPALPDNPVIFVNQAFTNITGYGRDEMIGRSCRILQGIHTNKDTARAISAKLRACEPVNETILNYRKDGTQFWNDLRINPIFGNDGKIANYIAMQSDITQTRATQEALMLAKEQAERATKIKTNFMAMISHEIRTPIGGMLGTLTLLQDTPLTDSQNHLVETALSSGESLMIIVNDMLDLSKMESGKFQVEATPFDMFELVESTCNLMRSSAEKKGIKLLQNVSSLLPRSAIGDPTRVKQVLLNFISNAIKFTQEGSVTVKVAALLEHESELGKQCVIRFEVIDTGIGISHEGQTQLFTEFNQLDASVARRYGGTGLGLAICKRLMTLMNGEVGVESRPGFGSKFWFVLPVTVAGASTPLTEDLQPETTHNMQGKILVVEDNQTNQLVLTAFLRKDGHEVTIAENGALALSAVQSGSYDLIYMDVSMPVMDGLTATQKIRALGAHYLSLPIIAMTAQAMAGDREKCLAAGMNSFISKPVDRALLRRETLKWLAQSRSRDVTSITSATPVTLQPATNDTNAPVVYDALPLKDMATEIGTDVVLNLISVFSADLQKRQYHLHEAITQHNWQTVTAESHALKSSSASCGLMEFAGLMKKIEFASRTGEIGAILSLAEQIDPSAKAAQAALKEAQTTFAGV